MRSHGWGDGHSRVGLDTDVVLGNKPLGAPELGLVPVLVVFHVQDLWVGETWPLGHRGETAVNCGGPAAQVLYRLHPSQPWGPAHRRGGGDLPRPQGPCLIPQSCSFPGPRQPVPRRVTASPGRTVGDPEEVKSTV